MFDTGARGGQVARNSRADRYGGQPLAATIHGIAGFYSPYQIALLVKKRVGDRNCGATQ